ncbi:DUF7344 domain-containing protein [Natronomonas marina]|uniref:DUF7344 domain-containing protein n=1 Tax=Natronomonas marina TaxID=2961939 RepID=UPI0020C9C33C|nr:hypothetical protein [Natronomonas marina]
MSTTVEEAEPDLEEREIHEILRNDRRRLALETLRQHGGEATVRELSERIGTHETGEDPPPRNKRQSVYVSLHQTHLPKLDELGIVEYDPDEKDVALTNRVQQVEVYMEVVPEYGLSWGELYFGLGLLGISTVVAALVGVPGVSSISLAYLVAGYFLLQMVAAAYHVYTQQDRIVFQRLLR